MTQSSVTLEGVVKTFGGVEVIKGVSLKVDPGELVVFVGPSGCGKSTLLRLIAGLEAADKGMIRIGERDVTHVHPSKRGIAMVFQSYALYPHMSVRENMAFGLKIRGMSRADADARVKRAAEILQLDQLLDRKPRALSGGQRQRAAIGRAIVREPDVFLFDEPLSNLDAALRGQMRVELARLHAQLGTTMIYVTHDQVEAMTLANKIVVLNAGRIEQIGAPLELYHHPANTFVAGFIGSPKMNFIAGTVSDPNTVTAAGVKLAIPVGAAKPGDTVTLGVRPEDFRIANDGDAFAGRVTLLEPLGSETIAHITLESGGLPLVVKLPGDTRLSVGDVVRLGVDAARAHLFDAEGRSLKARGG